MYMLIRYAGGIIVEGVLLARGRDRLRVAVSGFPETIELRRTGSRWITSGHIQVEFDFLLTWMNTKPRAFTPQRLWVRRCWSEVMWAVLYGVAPPKPLPVAPGQAPRS
jgi:hypothetical protein